MKLVDPDGQDVLNGSKLNWQEAKKEYRDFKMEVVKKYSDNFENLTFENHSDLKKYKKMMKKLKKLDETIKKEESNAKVVAYYIDQFNKKEHEKFEMLNNLSYKNESGEIKAYHIYVYIADGNVNLSENGGAYSTMCRKKNGEFFGIVRVPSGLGKDISGIIPHEFGHHVTYASNPFYWVIHNNPNLNCQENRKHDQAKLSIIWQEEWIDKIKEENSKK
ncbi:MAG: hypothetical protein MJZ11_12390 [Lachnospiraceae bacterium]|nr:hypothetical protein [Lachnospiraceae bacterium]